MILPRTYTGIRESMAELSRQDAVRGGGVMNELTRLFVELAGACTVRARGGVIREQPKEV